MPVAEHAVFLDTSGLLALIRARDGLHGRARRVMEELAGEQSPLVTSHWVLAELLGGTARPPLRQAAVQTVRSLLTSPHTSVIAATPASWAAAFDLYRSRPDKDWSLVDCSSIAICGSRGIRRVLSHDHHFEQAGLEALLR